MIYVSQIILKKLASGVLPLGISDHSLIYIVRKSAYPKLTTKIIKRRNFKHFEKSDFLQELSHLDWDIIHNSGDPNEMWNIWSHLFTSIVDKHAPIRETRIGKKRSPWITQSLLRKMRSRDFLRKKFEHTKDITIWNLYKKSRNEVNNLLKQSKRDYFRSNLDSAKNDPKKTWKLINQHTSRSDNKCSNINKVEVNGVEISDTCKIAEAFNTHFTEIGENRANKIPITDTDPISYIKPTNSTFAFKTIDVIQVKNLIMKINVNKSSGLDDISNKLLKLAADIVSQSLTHIFDKSLCTGIYPNDWKLPRVVPIHKSGAANYRPISITSAVEKSLEELSMINFINT